MDGRVPEEERGDDELEDHRTSSLAMFGSDVAIVSPRSEPA
jgi:hypothetical protein